MESYQLSKTGIRTRHFNCLPPEILVQIFPRYIGRDLTSPFFPLLHNLTSVCKLWRDLVINTPTMWSYISEDDIGTFRLMIERSGTAPLHLRVRNRNAVSLAATVMPRVCHILIDLRESELAPLLSSGAPILEELQIFTFGPMSYSFYSYISRLTKLRSLDLTNLSLTRQSIPQLESLTYLGLQNVVIGPHELLITLKGLPQLKKLYLAKLEYIPDISRQLWDSLATEGHNTAVQNLIADVRLPNLEMLEMHLHALLVQIFIESLQIPATATAFIDLSYDILGVGLIRATERFSESLIERFQHLALSRPSTTLRLWGAFRMETYRSMSRGTCITLVHSEVEINDDPWQQPGLHLAFYHMGASMGGYPPFITGLRPILSAASISTAWVDSTRHGQIIDTATLVKVLEQCPNIVSLHIGLDHMNALLRQSNTIPQKLTEVTIEEIRVSNYPLKDFERFLRLATRIKRLGFRFRACFSSPEQEREWKNMAGRMLGARLTWL
jgi:hypothetical protein